MDKHSAQTMIQDTLGRSFDKGRFFYFLKNMLNHVEGNSSALYKGSHLPDSYKPSIESLERLGKYNDDEGNEIDLLVVQLKRETSLERARTLQRNFASWHLKGGTGGNLKDAALTAYVSPDQKDWRFSFVKMDYKFVQSEKGRVRVKEEFTPARRYSFLVGENENSHTARSQLLPLLEDDDKKPTLGEIEDKFNIETVTKEFFEKYRDLFLRATDSLNEIVESDPKIKEDFLKKNVNTVDFSKKLLGQIVFLYFLQKKGWFGVEKNNDWGTGSKIFIRDLFNQKNTTYTNFFNDILEPLFYEALASERPSDYYAYLNCKIPFLNGGLFDPIGNYDWVHTDILLPNDLFSNKIQTAQGDIGTGIFDVFDRYNFTVKEDEPLEKEVAVDPEMLGKVFENLLEVKDRKSKGTFYTPREIVHYMCQESLTHYLEAELNGKVSKEEIEILIKFGETVVENDSRVARSGRETARYSYKLPTRVIQNATRLDKSLASIRICDPAVGSGAFLLGMMSEIVRIRNTLTNYLDPCSTRTPYDFKRNAIHDSLYGVDIDSGAVEICKLRLWLSLVVDEDNISHIQSLPNLDYKIVQGNSLLGVKKDLYNLKFFNELEEIKPKYFEEPGRNKKQKLKDRIDSLIDQICDGKKGFDFEIYFSEIFHEKNGFDVVIANPPYVRADSGHDYLNFRKKLKETGVYKTLYEKWDLMVPFFERGLSIPNTKGNLIFIVSNAICTSKYALKLLDLIQKEYFLCSIDYFEGISVFDAGVVPVVIHIDKANLNGVTKKIIRQGSFENIASKMEISTEKFKTYGRDGFRKEFLKVTPQTKIINLGNICFLSVGMVINADEKKAKGEFTKDDLISKTKTQVHSRKYIEGKDIEAYFLKRVRYLEWDTRRVPRLLRRPTFPELYSCPKIMRGNVTCGIYDDTGLICNHSIIVFVRFFDLHGVNNKSINSSIKKFNQSSRISLEETSKSFNLKYLLAILNSSFALKYLNNIRRHRLENYFYPDDFRKLPIADVSSIEQKPFSDLVDKILAITEEDDYLENPSKQAKVDGYKYKIDQMVYELYDLTPEEIQPVEKDT